MKKERQNIEIDVSSLLDKGSTTLTDRKEGEGTLDKDMLYDAMNLLGRADPRPFKVPYGTPADKSWSLALTIALFSIMRVNLKVEDGVFSRGQKVELRTRLPLGRAAADNLATTIVEDNVSDFMLKVETLKVLLHDSFNGVAQWIDIAQRAKHEYKVEDILKIRNIEQRMAAMRIFGPEKLIEESGAILLNSSRRGNHLYKIPKEKGLFIEDAYFLKYQCVSTGRIYVSGVPPELFDIQSAISSKAFSRRESVENDLIASRWMTNFRGLQMLNLEGKYRDREYIQDEWADLAMAWKFRLSLFEYQLLVNENEG